MSKQIYGLLMKPSFMNQDDFESSYRKSPFFHDSNFYEEYQNHLVALSVITDSAKIYILKNWEKISDWRDLNVDITDNSGTTTKYYKFAPRSGTWYGIMSKAIKELERLEEENEKIVRSLTNVVLDPSDGDFSLTINGKDHLWIDDESIVIIAQYIEQKLALK